MIRCPCCNARLRESVICPRCQADLSVILESEQSAQYWLSKAIQYWVENKIEQTTQALSLSVHLKKTKLATAFQGFLIDQQCRGILDLLTKKKLLSAKKRLYDAHLLIPHSKQLQHIQRFTDYLLIKDKKHSKPL